MSDLEADVEKIELEVQQDEVLAEKAEDEQEDPWKEDPSALSPFGVTSEERGDYEVKVCIVLLGLKKKLGRNEPSNAEQLVLRLKEQSFAFSLLMDVPGKTEKQKYQYRINRLPDRIVIDKCKYKIKKDQIELTLYKAVPRSWVPELRSGGLETQEDEEEK